MVGPPLSTARQPTAQPTHQLILKQVAAPFTMLAKPPAPNYVNYLSLPVMPSNGGYLAVTSKAGETNGTTILTVASPATENNNAPAYIAMDNLPHAHQYLIPKPEPFAMHNYSKNEPTTPLSPLKRRSPAAAAVATRPTNHQRIKMEPVEQDEEEGEETRPMLDPSIPYLMQLVRIDHSYPAWLATPSPREDDKESTISSDEKVDHNEEGEETETAAEGEDSVTRCICNFEHDDGYMISCDQCYVWQHVACVLPEIPVGNSLPDMSYLCDICQPRDLDRHRARALQLERKKQIAHRNDSSDDSWSSADRPPPPKKAVARRRAEPIPRRPSKRDSTDGPIRKSELRPKKELPEGSMRSKLFKAGKGRREASKGGPPSMPHSSPSVGRRTKLKRKFECKVNQRRKSNLKEVMCKYEKEKKEMRPRPIPERNSFIKSRCRLSQSSTGEPTVITSCRVINGEPLAELRGKYLQAGSPPSKSEVLFHYKIPKDGTDVLLDGTGRENVVRYAQRSCTPNAQLKHFISKGTLRLYLVAVETLDRNQPVLIPHGCITDTTNSNSKENCGKDCVYGTNNVIQKMSPRRRSRRCTVSEESDHDVDREALRSLSPLSPSHGEPDRKLTREEKKIEQAMKIFAQMERDTARKKDKTPGSMMACYRRGVDSDKESPGESGKPRRRRRRRKRRNSRKSRLNSTSGSGMAQTHSGDESDMSSGDDLPSPRDKADSKDSGHDDDDAAGLLLALGGARHNPVLSGRQTPHTTPPHHSENDSSPCTPLSSACILVAAAVGPLAPGFKFPKTKKGMMNEWLGKSPEHVPADLSPLTELGPPLPPGAPKISNLSSRLYDPVREQMGNHAGFGKKRWLRQAISEEAEIPLESPTCPPDNVTPLKKRRLARESLTSDPPATPPQDQSTVNTDDDGLFVSGENSTSPLPGTVEEMDMDERVRTMQRNYLAAQGIPDPEAEAAEEPPEVRYETSPQLVPENLTLTKSSPPSSPLTETRPLRRGRKKIVARTEPRPQRGKRVTRKSENMDTTKTGGALNGPIKENEACLVDDPSVRTNCVEVKTEVKEEEVSPPNERLSFSNEKQKELTSQDPRLTRTVKQEDPRLSNCNEVVKCEVNVVDPRMVKPEGGVLISDPRRSSWYANDVKVSWFNDNHINPSANMDLLASEAAKELGKPATSPSLVKDEKINPIRRKLSITEYLKRKKVREPREPNKENSPAIPLEDGKTRSASPVSDDEISFSLPMSFPDPTLAKGGFKEEPTELERQRENLNERLRREFGLAITDDETPRLPTEPQIPALPPTLSPTTFPEKETNGYPESDIKSESLEVAEVKLETEFEENADDHAEDIYPVGSSNPPNPCDIPYQSPERFKFRK